MSNLSVEKLEFQNATTAYKASNDFTRAELRGRLLNAIDILARSKAGMEYLYENIGNLENAGIFRGTVWSDPTTLVPTLAKGTIQNGHPHSSLEILSELRLLSRANGNTCSTSISSKAASDFIVKVLVHNLEFALAELNEESRALMNPDEQKKAINLFRFLLVKIDPQLIKEILAEEITTICKQRPVVTSRVKELIALLNPDLSVYSNTRSDKTLARHVNAVHHPTQMTREASSAFEYRNLLMNQEKSVLAAEAEEIGQCMRKTGLVSQHHAVILRHLCNGYKDLVPDCLGLTESGKAEWNRYQELISGLIEEVVHPHNSQCIYGLARMMNRSIFSSSVVRTGLENIRKIRIHPHVEKCILKSVSKKSEHISPRQYLLGATFRVLGQPLGVGQGNNPTCQSARGISMWALHNPGRLIDLISTATTQNHLIFRFENRDLDSSKLAHGLAEKIDYKLDAVSVVLVPHLDKIYFEMMKLASGRFEDPHKWVNPAMYGSWVPLGFASAYDYYSNSILDFKGFINTFFKHFHLDYNGHKRMTYPNPVGIFLTSATGKKVGFHAVALMRVQRDRKGCMRAYFLNPNNEGRQDWGQGIEPKVHGNGEQQGESSLPFEQFASRIYAFHFDSKKGNTKSVDIPYKIFSEIEKTAKESWGKDYIWLDGPKVWG